MTLVWLVAICLKRAQPHSLQSPPRVQGDLLQHIATTHATGQLLETPLPTIHILIVRERVEGNHNQQPGGVRRQRGLSLNEERKGQT